MNGTPERFQWPRIQYDQSVAIIGPKKSGKSEVLANLLRTKKNALVFDTKRIEHWENVGEILPNANDVWRIRNGRFVYRVPREFTASDDVQSRLFLAMLDCKGPRITALDEAYNYADTLGLRLLATQGRASLKGLWVAMQRPFGMPLYLLSEPDHYFIFSLTLKRDRERVAEMTGGAAIPWDKLARVKHGFVHFEPGKPPSRVARLPKEAMLLSRAA